MLGWPRVIGTLMFGVVASAATSPIVPGLSSKHGLDEVGQGRVLAQELRCAACHDGFGDSAKPAPVLAGIATRVTPGFLQAFLENPSQAHTGTKMPDLLLGKTAAERSDAARALSHYLRSVPAASDVKLRKGESGDLKRGQELFERVGCMACHSPRDAKGKEQYLDGSVSLAHVAEKYRVEGLAAFLFDPLSHRPGGRMPDLNLTSAEATDIATFLMGGKVETPVAAPDTQLVQKGAALAKELNCTVCHEMPYVEAKPRLPKPSKLEAGCLGKAQSSVPNFALSAAQQQVLRAFLRSSQPVTKKATIHERMVSLNCIACHERDDFGGVSEARDGFFHTTQEALGNEARIPPPLTGVGAKLRPEWLHKVLFERESVRPYIQTRMPQYGELALKDLPELLAEVDKQPEITIPEPNREQRKTWREAGTKLLGDKGLNCIACHNFNGTPSPGMQGVDVMTSFQRLQPGWFLRYMKAPAAFRPGIVMPSYWPNGEAVQKEILGGSTDEQLAALWHVFSLGRSARTPSGMSRSGTKLTSTNRVRVYRGRSRIAGYRGIAVGFPEQVNYAFNAKNGVISGVWKGEFVNVNWGGQGAGDFSPAAQSLQLPNDLGIRLASDAPWPLRPTMTKEKPEDPDPTYPRNHGYAFKGYSIDEAGVPSFAYRIGDVAVQDRTVAESANAGVLVRRLMLRGAGKVQVRLLAGPGLEQQDKTFVQKGLRVVAKTGTTSLRAIEGGHEAVLTIEVPTQGTEVEIRYELP